MSAGPDVEKVLRVAITVFNLHGLGMQRSKLSRVIRRGFRVKGMEGALIAVQNELLLARAQNPAEINRIFLRALSLECVENPFVASWYRNVSAGLPGLGVRS